MRPDQSSLPFPHRVDPDWCESVIKHRLRRVRPTHIVTIPLAGGGRKSFRLCVKCMRPYEAMHSTKIEKIKETR